MNLQSLPTGPVQVAKNKQWSRKRSHEAPMISMLTLKLLADHVSMSLILMFLCIPGENIWPTYTTKYHLLLPNVFPSEPSPKLLGKGQDAILRCKKWKLGNPWKSNEKKWGEIINRSQLRLDWLDIKTMEKLASESNLICCYWHDSLW